MQCHLRSLDARSRFSLAFLVIAAAGCASIVLVTPQYEPTGVNLPLGLGDGTLIRLEVVDDRVNPLHLGITEDIYKTDIQLSAPVAPLVEDMFLALLSQAGFLFSDQAKTTYRVRIRSVSTVVAQAFGAEARASVSLEVKVLAGGRDLGGKVISGSGTVPKRLGTAPGVPSSQALSIALSQAAERAVGDVQLAELAKQTLEHTSPGEKSAIEEAATTERPILYFDAAGRELVIKAVYADGQELGILTKGQLIGWSPDGEWFAFLKGDLKLKRGVALKIRNLDGDERSVFEAGANEEIFLSGWQSIWSPDSRRVAVIVMEGPTARGRRFAFGAACRIKPDRFSMVIIDVKKRSVLARHALPKKSYEPMVWAPYKSRWSPDGKKILLSWERTIVVDADTGAVQTITSNPAMAEWAPDSAAVYFFDGIRPRQSLRPRTLADFYVKSLGSYKPVKLVDKAALEASGFQQPLLIHAPLMSLSAEGSKMALAGGSTGGALSTIRIYETRLGERVALDKPAGSFEVEEILTALAWSPHESAIAMLAVDEGAVKVKLLDLGSGELRALTTLAFPPRVPDIDVIGLVNTLSWASQ